MTGLLIRHATKIRFAIIGSFNTALDFAILLLLTTTTGTSKEIANIISTTFSFLFSFAANRKFTFKSTNTEIRRQFIIFTIITLFGLWVIQTALITILVPIGLSCGLHQSASLIISKLIATVVSLTWNYILYAKIVFKE